MVVVELVVIELLDVLHQVQHEEQQPVISGTEYTITVGGGGSGVSSGGGNSRNCFNFFNN